MKILWVKNNLLHPLDTGGKIRTYNMLKNILKEHEIHYVTYADPTHDRESLKSAVEYCSNVFYVKEPKTPKKDSIPYYLRIMLNLMSKFPFTISSYYSRDMEYLISNIVRKNEYDVLVADFLTMCKNIPNNINIPRVHFSHNVEYMIWDRYVKNELNPIKRLVFMRERDRVKWFERKVINTYALTIAVSKNDRDFFSTQYKGTNLGYLSTGVDTQYFSPGERVEDPQSIIFLGSMDWMPNIDAVHFFVKNVYPAIKKEIPTVRLYIVGRNPVDSIKMLEKKNMGIIVTGTVIDTRPYIDQAACAVVPLRVGGGTRIKIYEMMSMEKAVISTTLGAEGLGYINGENILIADESSKFSQIVINVLRDKSLRERIGKKARLYVEENCSWKVVTDRFVELLAQTKGS